MKRPSSKRTMFGKANANLFRMAAENREKPTASEATLWQFLRKSQLGVRFKFQHPVDKFIVDFYCHALSLVIEVDGDYHLTAEQSEYDQARSYQLQNSGLKVIRFKNQEVQDDIDTVLTQIKDEIARGLPSGNKRAREGSANHFHQQTTE